MAKRKYMSLDGEEFPAQEDEIQKFHDAVVAIVEEHECSYMEAIAKCCEEKNIDIDTVTCLISPVLKNRIRREAHELNMLKPDSGVSILDF